MNVAALDRQTSLSRVYKRGPNRAAGSDLDVSVIEHDHGIFAAQFKHYGKQSSCRSLRDSLSCCNTPGKYQFVDLRFHERCTSRAIAEHQLKNIFRKSGI